jgi:hypothetical protein
VALVKSVSRYPPMPRHHDFVKSDPVRVCAVCGSSLEGFRPQACYCGGGCRTEAWRIRRLVSGVFLFGSTNEEGLVKWPTEEQLDRAAEIRGAGRSNTRAREWWRGDAG